MVLDFAFVTECGDVLVVLLLDVLVDLLGDFVRFAGVEYDYLGEYFVVLQYIDELLYRQVIAKTDFLPLTLQLNLQFSQIAMARKMHNFNAFIQQFFNLRFGCHLYLNICTMLHFVHLTLY